MNVGEQSWTGRIQNSTTALYINSANKNLVLGTTDANQARLSIAPTISPTDKTSLAIATCGYVNKAVSDAAVDTSKFVTISTT